MATVNTSAVNKIPKSSTTSGWPSVTGYAFMIATLSYCFLSMQHRIDCKATVSLLWSSYASQDPPSVCNASGSYLDIRGMANHIQHSRQPTGVDCRLSVCATVVRTYGSGHRLNPAPARGSPSGAVPTAQAMSGPLLLGRIAPQSVAKTFFQLQAKLEPMSLEERGRTGLTSKATGNPFAFTERPANGTNPLDCPSLALQPSTGLTERWRLWRPWTDRSAVTICAPSIIKGSLHQYLFGRGLAHNTQCQLLCDAAAFSLSCHCTVVCRQQRPPHAAGEEHGCPVCISSSYPWHRLEGASPGAHLPSARPPLAVCLNTQVLSRLEVSSPEPYFLIQERVSLHLDPSKVAPPSVLCPHFHHDGLGRALSKPASLCGARWIAGRCTACILLSTAAVSSQTEFRHCHLPYLTARTWPSALQMVNRLLGPLPKHDPPPDRVPQDLTPRRRTVLRDLFTLRFLRLPAPLWLPETCLLPQRRFRRQQGPRSSPTRCSRPRLLPQYTRRQGLRRRTRRAFPPVPMLRCPATGLIRSWGGGGAGVCTCTFLRTRPPPPSPTFRGTNTLLLCPRGPFRRRQRHRRQHRPDRREGQTETLPADHWPSLRSLSDARQLPATTDAGTQPDAKDQPSVLSLSMSLRLLLGHHCFTLSVLHYQGSTWSASWPPSARHSALTPATAQSRCLERTLQRGQASNAFAHCSTL